MSVSVISNCGAPVIIDTSSSTDPYTLPNATRTTLGGVKVGDNLSVASGVLSVPQAAYQSKGVVSQAAPVEDVETIPVTDIQSAQDAIAAMGTTLSELIQALRASGVLGVQS